MTTTTLDPGRFAQHLVGHLPDDIQDARFRATARAEYAEYRAARAALRALLPADLPFDHPVNRLDEAAHAWAGECYERGLAVGAACEGLRRHLLGAEPGPAPDPAALAVG